MRLILYRKCRLHIQVCSCMSSLLNCTAFTSAFSPLDVQDSDALILVGPFDLVCLQTTHVLGIITCIVNIAGLKFYNASNSLYTEQLYFPWLTSTSTQSLPADLLLTLFVAR